MSGMDYTDILFDGPPGAESGRFVEVENSDGKNVSVGEWVQRDDGYWVLRLPISAEQLSGREALKNRSPVIVVNEGELSDETVESIRAFVERQRGGGDPRDVLVLDEPVRLANPFADARKIMVETFQEDEGLWLAWYSNIAMLLHDKHNIIGKQARSRAASDIMKLMFETVHEDPSL